MIESKFKPNKAKKNEAGAIWEKKSAKDKKYFRIKIVRNDQEYWFVAFENGFKTSDSQPEYVIYEDDPNDARINKA